MRVLLGINRLWRGGGTETHVMTLADRLKKMGHRVVIFTSGGGWVQKARNLGIPVHVERDLRSSTSKGQQAFRKFVRINQFDLVHVHDGPTLGLASRALVGRKDMPPIVYTLHGSYVGMSTLLQASRKAKAIICVSPTMRRTFLRKVPTVPGKVTVVSNGIRGDVFHPSAASGRAFRMTHKIPLNAFVIGYSARFTFDKTELGRRVVRVLRRYVKNNPNVHVVVAGRNSKNVVSPESRLHVLGHVEDMQNYYNACDALIGTARVATEGIACGVPTICIGKGGFHGRVTSENLTRMFRTNFGDHSTTVYWKNVDLLREIRAFQRDRTAIVTETGNVRARVIRRLSAEQMARRTELVYKQAVRAN
ncbi:glycosyltransferase family 4 protein [Alicyclobacillus dauci]|uniref:Glycosyltransferase family 4 protein n=1 Tax=Alicyclobacillus dauci TaxID=1475485 RepID=A0ABY6Z087_9BACL|nr:glycosyltransferase family 4 protein [Alicyclobacillus dauci]WAH36127.1 glycosyltransferase family 4 protein [Alicyclobacillus dauci]